MGAAGAGALMGGLGSLMGGNSKSSGSSSSDSSSQQQSNNAQASNSNSNQQSSNASGSANQSYGALSQAFSPTLGYTATAGNMIASLLGLPTNNNFYSTAPATQVLPNMPTPAPSGSGSGAHGNKGGMIDQLFAQYQKGQTAAPAPAAPTPGATMPLTPTAGGNYAPAPDAGAYGAHELLRSADRREMGGPVQAGQPYVVGEKRPELFVPHTSGQIVPQVPPTGALSTGSMLGGLFGKIGHPKGGPGNPGVVPPVVPPVTPPVTPPTPAPTPWTPSAPANSGQALNDWANSAGMKFAMDQGTNAIANTGAASGTFQSGATGKALQKFGMDLGNTYQNDYINHLFDFAKLGLGGGQAMSGAGGVSQGVGSSSGGSSSSSFGYGNSSGSSDSSSDSTQKSKSKQGLGI